MSAIEWTDETWNPVAGCRWASPGCDNCYAARMTRRLEAMGQQNYAGLTTQKHFNGQIRTLPDKLEHPLKWKKPRMVFVNSMSDLFHPDVPFEFVDQVFAVMALCPQHTFQVLTKRPDRMAEYLNAAPQESISGAANSKLIARLPDREPGTFRLPSRRKQREMEEAGRRDWPLPNVWLGTSVEDQERADERIPHLLRCPAAVRFLSCEPLLGPVNLFDHLWAGELPQLRRDNGNPLIDWVIAGGESGPNSRPCQIEWITSIRDQCAGASVPCFVKQLGSKPQDQCDNKFWPRYSDSICDDNSCRRIKLKSSKGGNPAEWPEDLRVREFPRLTPVCETSKEE